MHIIAERKTKLHSSATINKHKKNILEEVQKKIQEYSICAEVEELKKLADNLQVFWQPSDMIFFLTKLRHGGFNVLAWFCKLSRR